MFNKNGELKMDKEVSILKLEKIAESYEQRLINGKAIYNKYVLRSDYNVPYEIIFDLKNVI